MINKNNMIVEVSYKINKINDDLKNYEIEFKKNNENFNEIIVKINLSRTTSTNTFPI